jgi:Ca2+-binding RTX toxin-like protein
LTNIIRGTSGNDSLTGTIGSDEILTYAGEDTVRAGDGDDYINSNETTLWANSGRLIAYGGSGNDKINATDDGDDQLYGEDGDDTLYGRDGNDTLDGGSGDDYLSGGGGDDSLEGGEDDDELWGRSGNDVLYGGPGNDLISGEGNDIDVAGEDRLYGQEGDDKLYGWGGNDTLDGGSGDDYLGGGGGDDSLEGGEDDDQLYGQGGSDTLDGGPGDDYLSGGDGDDSLEGGEDDDQLWGGRGSDNLYYSSGSDFIDGGDGEDSLFFDVSLKDIKKVSFYGTNVSFAMNQEMVDTKKWVSTSQIENYYFSNKKYTFWELLLATQENTYLESYYLKSVEEKEKILKEFRQENFSASSYIKKSLNNNISIFWPEEAVRDSGSNMPDDYVFTAISEEEKIEFNKSLDYLSSYIDISFEEADSYAGADIFVEKHEMTAGGYASELSSAYKTAIAINDKQIDLLALLGVFVHELGHTLHLDHPNDYIILKDDNDNFSGWEPPKSYSVDQHLDFNRFSVMSYLDGVVGFNSVKTKTYSFGPLDIAYLEEYGTTNGVDTTFIVRIDQENPDLAVTEELVTINVTPSRSPFLLADSGGIDHFTAAEIDIDTTLIFDFHRGYFGTDITTVDGKYALQNPLIEIYPTTQIEKFTGHQGIDHFILGDLTVRIDALDGDDSFHVYGKTSAEIHGGKGDDSIYFSETKETYEVNEEGGETTVRIQGSVYSLESIENIYFDGELSTSRVIEVAATSIYRTSILVNKGVVGELAILLEDLSEKITMTDGVATSHVFSYNGSDYDYDDISSFILIVVRDNEFTDEFRSELADYAPEFKDILYQDAVDAVGLIGISEAIITVAGSDGSYIS